MRSITSKFDIDADGSGPSLGDPNYQPDFSERPPWRTQFYDITPVRRHPLPQAARAKLQDAGLGLGDLGIAFYQSKSAAFLYGDEGPDEAIGEGSVFLATRAWN